MSNLEIYSKIIENHYNNLFLLYTKIIEVIKNIQLYDSTIQNFNQQYKLLEYYYDVLTYIIYNSNTLKDKVNSFIFDISFLFILQNLTKIVHTMKSSKITYNKLNNLQSEFTTDNLEFEINYNIFKQNIDNNIFILNTVYKKK